MDKIEKLKQNPRKTKSQTLILNSFKVRKFKEVNFQKIQELGKFIVQMYQIHHKDQLIHLSSPCRQVMIFNKNIKLKMIFKIYFFRQDKITSVHVRFRNNYYLYIKRIADFRNTAKLNNLEQTSQNPYDFVSPSDYQHIDIYNNYSPYYQNIDDNQISPKQNISNQIEQINNGISYRLKEQNQLVDFNSSNYLQDNRLIGRNDISYSLSYNNGLSPHFLNSPNSSMAQLYSSPRQLSQSRLGVTQNQQIQNSTVQNKNKNDLPNQQIQQNNNPEQINSLKNKNTELTNSQQQNKLMSSQNGKNITNQKSINNSKGQDNIIKSEQFIEINQYQIQKRWEIFDIPFKNTIASIITEQNESFIYKFDPQGQDQQITCNKIDYQFNQTPSSNIAIDQRNGRLFVYDNDGNILVFSQDLEFNEGQPITVLSLDEEFPRKNPTLYLKTYSNYTLLFVIGGFVRQQTVGQIKVFQILRRNASIKCALTIKMLYKRRNPVVFTYSVRSQQNNNINQSELKKTSEQIKQTSEQIKKASEQIKQTQETETEYLILIGGSCHDAENESNITGEYIEMNKIHQLMKNRKQQQIEINNKIKIRLHSSFDDSYEISSYLTSSIAIVWIQEEEQKNQLLLFSEKKKNVLEIKNIDLRINNVEGGVIDIIYSDITHNGHRGLMRMEGEYLSYFDQRGKDIHIVSIKTNQEVYSSQKKATFFKKNVSNKKIEQKNIKDKQEEDDDFDEEIVQQDKVLSSNVQKQKSQKDSASDVKETKDQSQNSSDKKKQNINQPEEILSNNNSQNENQLIKNEKKDEEQEQKEENKLLNEKGEEEQKDDKNKEEKEAKQKEDEEEEEEEEEEDEEEEEKSKKDKKNKDKKNKKSQFNVNSKRNKFFCKCYIFQMAFFL